MRSGSFSVEASLVMGLLLVLLAAGTLLFLDVFSDSLAAVQSLELPEIAETAGKFRLLQMFAR